MRRANAYSRAEFEGGEMSKTKAEELYEYCEAETRNLSDADYVDCFEDLISSLQSSVNAKKEEMEDD
jgi:hypothetical protein